MAATTSTPATTGIPQYVISQHADRQVLARVNAFIHKRALRMSRDGLCTICARFEWIRSRPPRFPAFHRRTTEHDIRYLEDYQTTMDPSIEQLMRLPTMSWYPRTGLRERCKLCSILCALYKQTGLSNPALLTQFEAYWEEPYLIEELLGDHQCRSVIDQQLNVCDVMLIPFLADVATG